MNFVYDLVDLTSDAILITTPDPLELHARLKTELESGTPINNLGINVVEYE